MHSIGEVVKQFEFDAEPLTHPIKGKIVRYTSEDGDVHYRWSIRHHYKPAAGAGVYFPSVLTASSLEDAENHFSLYAGSFVATFEVKRNENY